MSYISHKLQVTVCCEFHAHACPKSTALAGRPALMWRQLLLGLCVHGSMYAGALAIHSRPQGLIMCLQKQFLVPAQCLL